MNKFVRKIILFPFILLAFHCFCSKREELPVLKYPAKHFENYRFNDSSSLISRVAKTPPIVIEFMKDLDGRKYTAYVPDNDDMKIIARSLKKLPPLTKRVLKKKLLGIYFINDLWGSGFADWVIDRERNIYTFLIFNPDVLKKSLSKMITDKEQTCFIRNDKRYRIDLDCGRGNSGFLYIMLHESGHVVDYIAGISPYVEPDMVKIKGMSHGDGLFTKGIWEGYKKAVGNYRFMERVTFYGFGKGPKINISEAADIYRELAGSPFVSLYSTLNWAEDIVELLTFYHITEKMKRPFVISVFRDNKLVYRLEPMKNPLVRKRFSGLKIFYK